MKKNIFKILLIVLVFLIVFVSGMVMQKKYGLGNIIKELDSRYVPENKIEVIPEKYEGKLSIFVLAGQSNMEGMRDINDYPSIDTRGKVFVFNDKYRWAIGKEPVREKVGPSISFAADILKKFPDKIIGIVNVAHGDVNIGQWEKNFADTSLYQIMIKRALAASAQGKIEGILFYQGEGDAEGKIDDHYDDWDIQFEKFVKDLRHDLHNDSLPVVFAQIGKGSNAYWLKVKKCQERVHLNHVSMIKTDDIKNLDNSVHFSSDGYVEIGKRFAEKFMNEYMTSQKE
jgi:hypothetical protein